jgi:hypothetical protein
MAQGAGRKGSIAFWFVKERLENFRTYRQRNPSWRQLIKYVMLNWGKVRHENEIAGVSSRTFGGGVLEKGERM